MRANAQCTSKCFAVVLGMAVWNTPVISRSQPDEATAAAGADLALTISGGVSLGSYEAGYLYLSTQTVRHTQGRYTLRLLTGASAGSVNALVTAINSCRPPNRDPHEDLGWRTWVELGYEDLFQADQVGPMNVFTRKGLEEAVERVRQVWDHGLSVDCDVVVGISTTRLRSHPVALNEALALPRQEEKFAFRIRGRGEGQPPVLTNYVDVESGLPQALLPLVGDGSSQDFDRVRDLLFASSAFPLAFAPQELDYCLTDPNDPETWECTSPTRHEPFIDGGVFDDNPLRLAARLANLGLRVDDNGRGMWRDLGPVVDDTRVRYEKIIYQYLDPDTTSYPTPEAMTAQDEVSTLSFLSGLLGDLITTARAKELYTLAEEQPDLVKQLFVTHRNFPTMSGLLVAFLGFFEREFREFDFYLGMYDAYAEAGHRLERSGDPLTFEALLTALHPSLAAGDPKQISANWKPFACMIGWYEPAAQRVRAACDGPELEDFRILLQVSLDRLYARCANTNMSSLESSLPHYHCSQAATGAQPPRVVPSKHGGSNPWNDDESEFDYVMGLLDEYQFHFEDLGLDRDEARYAPVRIRRKLLKMVNALAEAQPTRGQRTVILTGGRALVNTIAYEPPKNWGYFTLGTGIEVGGSFLPFEWNRSWARLNLAFQVGSLRTVVNPHPAAVTFSFVGGPEIEMLWWTTPVIQPLFGIRGGYQFGTADRFTARTCTFENSAGDSRRCSQPVTQAYVAFSLLERFRAQFTFVWFPKKQSFDDRKFDLLAGFGLHFF